METALALRAAAPPERTAEPEGRMSKCEAALFGIVLLSATAAFSWDGVLLGVDGAPMRGARVQVLGQREVVLVQKDGTFSIASDIAPPFDLLITRTDGVVIQPIRVDALPAEGPLTLQVEPAMRGNVAVLGAAPDLELPPAAAFTLAGRGDIEQRAPRQLGDVLATIPGTDAVGNGPAAVPAVRGMTSGRTLILLDDGRVTAERRAGPSATFLDPSTVEEVEVVRGPGSVAYGSDAFGGLIRARTAIHSPGEAPQLRWSVTGGTVDDLRSTEAEYGCDLAGGGFTIGAHWREYDDYESPEATVPNSGWSGHGARLAYQHNLGPGVLRGVWRSDLARDVGKPAADYETRPTLYPEESSHRLTLGYEQPGAGAWSRLTTSVFWAEYQLITDSTRISGDSGTRTVADVFSHDWGLRLEAERTLGARTRLVTGVDASGRMGLFASNTMTTVAADGTVSDRSYEVSIEDANRSDLGLFAGLSTSLGPVGLSGGLRFDRVASENRGGYFGDDSRSENAVSGFAALTVPLAERLELSLQVARGFRDALLSDRYYRGVTGRGFITGNPNLDPETSRQLDLALRCASGRFTVAGYGYLYRIDDLLERYKIESDYFFRNRGKAEIKGAELEVLAALGRGLLAQAAVQWQRGEILDDGSDANDVPSDGVILTLRRDPSVGRFWWLARAAVWARDDRPGSSEQVVPGYATVDLGVGRRLSSAIEIQLLGRNLLDRSYLDSSDENAVLAPGRSVELTLRGSL
jgi:outer membrane receptor protein involved in Fe transport